MFTTLELLKQFSTVPDSTQTKLTLQVALGRLLVVTRGYSAPEVGVAYTRAHTLCREIGETLQLFPVLYGLWQFYIGRADFGATQETGERLFSIAVLTPKIGRPP